MLSTEFATGTALWMAFSTYVLAVIILYRFPGLLHTKRKQKYEYVLIAHRGGSAEKIENTIGAFRHAAEVCKADVLELDLHLTKDKQVVVVHDSDLKRLTGKDLIVEETNYKDLPELKQHPDVAFDPGARPPVCEDTRIPLFEEVLQQFPLLYLHIDLKHGSEELVQKVIGMLHCYNHADRCIWGSTATRVMEFCYSEDPSIAVFCSKSRVSQVVFLFWTGLLAFLPLREHAYELPHPQFLRGELQQLPGFAHTIVEAVYGLAFNSYLFRYLRRRGLKVCTFVINGEGVWKEMIDMGVSAMHTDRPQRMRQLLDRHPQLVARAMSAEDDLS